VSSVVNSHRRSYVPLQKPEREVAKVNLEKNLPTTEVLIIASFWKNKCQVAATGESRSLSLFQLLFRE
jgi:hypothetical protein